MKKETKQLEKEELKQIQEMQNDFNNLKARIADNEIHKHTLLREVDGLRAAFADLEKGLIEKYGENSVLNMATGEITYKDK